MQIEIGNLAFDPEWALLWIVLLPLFGAILNGLFGRFASRKLVAAVAVGSVAGAFLLAIGAFLSLWAMRADRPDENVRIAYDVYEWFSIVIGNDRAPIGVAFSMDALSGVMTLVVTGIGLLIHVYSVGYMSEEPSFARFFSYLNLFTASMLILVLASNMPLMFVGWEGVGLCSYLLIGFWYTNPSYAAAGRKAFVVNRIGDFGVLIGMFILVEAVGSFDFSAINAAAPGLAAQEWTLGNMPVGSVAAVACAFLFLGCTGKSAQIPLFVWLPDAMAGPTPVSALIHAATMVTAGVYLCCRMSPLFVQAPYVMAAIALIGAATAFLAATIGLVQNEIKKILAYSTVSQLGFMFAAVGVGAFSAGFFHVFTHAFFKACLFLGAGSVMHAVGAHGDADIRKLGGLKKYLPTTHWTFLASCLAIAGVPGLSGFFSKDLILLGAAGYAASDGAGISAEWAELRWVGWVVFGTLVVSATMTAFYMFRLYFMTFTGEYRSAAPAHAEGEHHEEHGYDAHPHESPSSITVPLMILAAGAIVAGWLNLDPILSFLGQEFNPWGEWLAPSVAALGADLHGGHNIAAVGGLFAMAVGIGIAWSFYAGGGRAVPARIAESMPALHRFLFDKWRVDELYEGVLVGPIRWLATLSGNIDKTFVDGLLTKVTSWGVYAGGWLFTRVQNGLIYSYAAVLVVGMAVLAWWFLTPHPIVQTDVRGVEAKLTAGRGLGYEYRWDANGDGEFESDWSAEGNELTHRYEDAKDYRALTLMIGVPRGRGSDEVEHTELEEGEPLVLSASDMTPGWEREGGSGTPPALRVRGEEIVLRPNGARVWIGGREIEEEVKLGPGDTFFIGPEPMMGIDARRPYGIGAIVEAKVEVRNAFGTVARETLELEIQPASGGGTTAGAEASLAPGAARAAGGQP